MARSCWRARCRRLETVLIELLSTTRILSSWPLSASPRALAPPSPPRGAARPALALVGPFYPCGDVVLTLALPRCTTRSQEDPTVFHRVHVGFGLWDAAHALSYSLQQHPPAALGADARVLELGCGAAPLLGLYAAALAAVVSSGCGGAVCSARAPLWI